MTFSNNSKRRAVGIFAKSPVSGRVKTRLSPPFSSDETVRLYVAMLGETICRFSQGSWSVLLFYAGDQAFFQQNYPQYQQIEQVGTDLGGRMDNALQLLLSKGFDEVALIGSDSPDLPLELAEQAFSALDDHHAAAIPTDDGGYAMICLRQQLQPLFENIAWSTESVLRQTEDQAKTHNISLATTKPWSDIDDIDSLRAFLLRSPNFILAQLIKKEFSHYL